MTTRGGWFVTGTDTEINGGRHQTARTAACRLGRQSVRGLW
jgi:hypothetical protein